MHLNTLLKEAELARASTRLSLTCRFSLSDSEAHAMELADSVLAGPLPARVECDTFISHAICCRTRASSWIRCFKTAIAPISLPRRTARALAVAIDEVVRFIDGTLCAGEHVAMCLVMAVDDQRLIVGLRAEGLLDPVANLAGTTSLLRANAIVDCLQGELQRGIENENMVFGIALEGSPWLTADGRRE